MVKARTNDKFWAVIDNAAPVNYDKNQQLMFSLEKAQTASEVRLAQWGLMCKSTFCLIFLTSIFTELNSHEQLCLFIFENYALCTTLNAIRNFLSMNDISGETLEESRQNWTRFGPQLRLHHLQASSMIVEQDQRMSVINTALRACQRNNDEEVCKRGSSAFASWG